ncbi:MAG: S1 RNA-binding domain-containing protein, partial [Aquificae bacterium]|nr:S1 RNA-binding domain-containing protein [Aquificota bacterium]
MEDRDFHQEFEKLLQEETNLQTYSKGDIVKGVIVRKQPDITFVDIGQKTEVAIDTSEVEEFNEGDEIEAVYLGKRGKEGYLLISRRPITFKQTVEKLQQAYNNRERVKAKLLEKKEKGFLVSLSGLRAYLPISQAGLKEGEELPPAEFEVYIINFDNSGKSPRIVVSRKSVIKEDLQQKKDQILQLLKEGQTVRAKVKKITDKGVILTLEDAVDGFLPNSLYSWDKSRKPQQELSTGEELEVVVKEIDNDKQRVLFSRRDLEPDAWKEFDKQIGDEVEAVVKGINDHGLVVKVGDLEGFIYKMETDHINPLDYKNRFKVGQTVKAKIIELDRDKRRLKLSIKATTPHPVDQFISQNPEGSTVKGKIKETKNKIAIIDLGDIEGILHLEDATWNPKIKNINTVLKAKKPTTFKVLGKEGNRVKLGLKPEQDPFEVYVSNHKEG